MAQILHPSSSSTSKVIKISSFKGRLSERALYIYLPPGYDDNPNLFYPVIYMHDGQNIFEQHVHDSYGGSWQADRIADKLIRNQKMQASIIVGISNGNEKRLFEYLPPYATFRFGPQVSLATQEDAIIIQGTANKTFAYYQDDIVPYLKRHYRIRDGREHTATCGSSMGGLFSTYIALEHPDFARHHAALSPSYWMTNDGNGKLETIERIKTLPRRDIRLWLDSGEGRNIPGRDDDNKFVTLEARDALLEAGYQPKKDFHYSLAKKAKHNEASWAARLPRIFAFLFPPLSERNDRLT